MLPDGDFISNVTYASGNLSKGNFTTVTWNGTDAIFTGSTASSYGALGGAHVVFDVTETTPEPSSILLLGSGALTLLGMIRRKMRA